MKNKAYVPMVLLSLTLLFIVISPTIFIKVENNYMVDKISLSSVEADAYGRESEETYNLWERIKVLIDYSFSWENELNVNSAEYDTVIIHEEVMRQLETQIQEVQKYQGLPEMILSDAHSSIVKNTYMKVTNGKYADVLEVWAIQAIYSDYEIYAFLDCQTYALYDISIRTVREPFDYSSMVTGDGFMKYLETITPLEETSEDRFMVDATYEKRAIHLCLMSESKDTLLVESYCFHQDGYTNTQIMDYQVKKIK